MDNDIFHGIQCIFDLSFRLFKGKLTGGGNPSFDRSIGFRTVPAREDRRVGETRPLLPFRPEEAGGTKSLLPSNLPSQSLAENAVVTFSVLLLFDPDVVLGGKVKLDKGDGLAHDPDCERRVPSETEE
jgi:hypothetical protein